MKHDEDLLECGLEKRGVFPEFLAFNEPVGIFVPDEIIEHIASFSEAVMIEKMLHFPVGLVNLMANPVFTIVVDGDFFVAIWIFVD